jgi:hypothetical protein
MTWNGEQAKGVVLDATWEGLQRATAFFWETLQNVLNVSNPRPYQNSSRPGEPPRARTAHLKGHVIYEFDRPNLKSRVGLLPGAKYGAYLEFGTQGGTVIRPRNKKVLAFEVNGKKVFARKVVMKPLAARPWLFSTLKKILPQLQILAGSGGNTA